MLQHSWQFFMVCICGVFVTAAGMAKAGAIPDPSLSLQGAAMTNLSTDQVLLDLNGISTEVAGPALTIALEQLLASSDEPETPLSNAREVALSQIGSKEANVSSDNADNLARDVLRSHFNRPTTQMVLLREGEDRGYLPEGGEDIKENWVFSLVIPSLSDHIYWIVVSKDKVPKAYVYGFN